MSDISFKDQVVIVTGAGGGLGRTYAMDIARRGGKVVVNDFGGTVEGLNGSRAMADEVVAEITAEGGVALASYDSVADSAGAANIVAMTIAEFGRVDALINNAGNMINSRFEDSRIEDLDAILAVHLKGTYQVSKAVWPYMKAQGYGRLVFTASSAGLFGNEMQSAYAAAKAGVVGLMNVLSHEGAAHGILCNAVMPNAMSRMADQMLASMKTDAASQQRMSENLERLAALGNSMAPEFNTGLAVYLASDRCSSTHALYSHCAGRVARVYIGVTEGWQGSRQQPTSAEDIADHFDAISVLPPGARAPGTPAQEFELVLAQMR